ncbi:hypothetical protein RhiirA4_476479 [Rhizophagus irregularis]|uniref:Uncharacterized protein n=1 Tax=Rhizophagus irregularis TaxID=588596 RepID=A0A2I1HBM2_9GLOM|nr:hypothetical protein RhiirA4_476479 [Rhizophagus irregularis]
MNDFRKFKNNFLPNLSLIETLFCVIILANSIVALIETIDVWIRKDNFIEIALVDSLDCFFYSVLVITSGTITATFRTLNHILINFIVNVTFILKTYYLVMSREILVAMFSEFTYISLLVRKYGYNVENPLEILKYLPWPNILSCIIALIMIKGVREESNLSKEISVNPNNARRIIQMKIDIVLSIISIFLITITMINSIICHNKFGKGLKDYLLKDELEPFKESYYYKDDLDDYYERT